MPGEVVEEAGEGVIVDVVEVEDLAMATNKRDLTLISYHSQFATPKS